MPSVAEITYSTASQDYQSGSVSLDGALARISKADGHKKSYVGYETEDPAVLFWINDWVTKDARDELDKQADYAEIEAASRAAFGSEPTVNYVEFEQTEGALGAPITEFVTFTLNEGKTIAQLEPLVLEIHELLAKVPRFHGDSWAPIIGKPNMYQGILGWDTVDAHWKAVSVGRLKEAIDEVKAIADVWLVHAALRATPA